MGTPQWGHSAGVSLLSQCLGVPPVSGVCMLVVRAGGQPERAERDPPLLETPKGRPLREERTGMMGP